VSKWILQADDVNARCPIPATRRNEAGCAFTALKPFPQPPAARPDHAGIRLAPGIIVRSLLVAGVLAFSGGARGNGEKLATLKAGSESYTDVTVTSVTATDIYFSHKLGLGNAKLKNLDPELQKRFHYDPARAAEKEKDQAAAQARYAQVLKESKPPPPRRAAAAEEAEGPANTSDEVAPHEIGAKSFLNRASPDIAAEKWLTAPPSLTGKFLLVDFWATWCGPCRQAIPRLNDLANRFKDKLVVIGLSDQTEREIRRMTEPRIDYTIAIDTQHRASSAYGVERIPHAVLIDPKGIVRFEGHPGYLDERKLEKLLARYSE
jgi:cytochrome c biogenesis protein CcmG, thiol:disulfide interchange protein DsbE